MNCAWCFALFQIVCVSILCSFSFLLSFRTKSQFRRAIADNVTAESSRILGGAPVDELFALLSTSGGMESDARDSSPVIELEDLVCCLAVVAAGTASVLSLFHALFASYDIAQCKRVSEGEFVDLCATLLPIASALDRRCAPTFLRGKSPFEQRALIEPMALRVYSDAVSKGPERGGALQGGGEMDFLSFVFVLSSGIFRPVFKLEGNDVEVFDYIQTHSSEAATAWKAVQRAAATAAPAVQHGLMSDSAAPQNSGGARTGERVPHALNDVQAHAPVSRDLDLTDESRRTAQQASVGAPPPGVTPWTPMQRHVPAKHSGPARAAVSPRQLRLGAWRDENREGEFKFLQTSRYIHANTAHNLTRSRHPRSESRGVRICPATRRGASVCAGTAPRFHTPTQWRARRSSVVALARQHNSRRRAQAYCHSVRLNPP